jgi:pyrimidine-nucleoside phosphorylase
MRPCDIIRKKREGNALTKEELSFLMDGYLRDEVPDYQVSAFLMAVFFGGMTDGETIALTEIMLHSGKVIDLGDIHGTKIGKHSTGGVGDKPSIVLAPVMASMGVKAPMIAGRGLGHTGGTLDKLESIPGFKTDISIDEFKDNLRTVGCSIMGQTDETAPLDKKLYALRDASATADSIPLIASSVMSKKLAEGTGGLLLDVKCGAGAFVKDIDEARRLASLMVKIGSNRGVKTIALITDMNEPIGRTIGNSLEIKECISFLRGKAATDFTELSLMLASWMMNLADAVTEETPVQKINENTLRKYKHEIMDFIEKGDAFKKFVEMIDAQHGDPETAFTPSMLLAAKNVHPVKARKDGFIHALDAGCAGAASMLLGAGRQKMGDPIDHAAGIILNKKVGGFVKKDEPIAMFHYNDDKNLKEAEDIFQSGVQYGEREPARRPIVIDVVMG